MALSTVGAYLKMWGFTPQKPVRRAFEQSPGAVERWLEDTSRTIAARAKQGKAAIYWGDEMGRRSDHQTGRAYGLRGPTPVVRGTGQRFSVRMVSAITNRAALNFMIFEESLRVKFFLAFLARLIKQAKRKVFLVVDGLPVYRAKIVQAWGEAHRAELEIFYLPGYSPELNPDELWNQDLKSNALGRRHPVTKPEMTANVGPCARSTQRRPEVVRSYFREEHIRHAAGVNRRLY